MYPDSVSGVHFLFSLIHRKSRFFSKFVNTYSGNKMGEHICFRRNERLATVNPYWRGNPMVRGRFFNRQHRFRPGMGSVLKWRLSPNPQRKEKKTVKWDPKVCYLRSLDAVVGDSLIWLGHNSFFLQLAGKRIMFDPVFGSIPFVKRQSEFPANPDIFTEIDYLLVSHDHFDHLDKQSIARLLKNNPQMKLFCGLGTGELIQGWFPEMKVIEAGWYQQMEDEGYENVFVGTVEGYPNFETVLRRLKRKNITEVTLAPLMMVAGDHARNDMASDDEDSWKSMLEEEGIKVNLHMKGLGENEKFNELYINRIEDLINNRYIGVGQTKKGHKVKVKS